MHCDRTTAVLLDRVTDLEDNLATLHQWLHGAEPDLPTLAESLAYAAEELAEIRVLAGRSVRLEIPQEDLGHLSVILHASQLILGRVEEGEVMDDPHERLAAVERVQRRLSPRWAG